MKTGREHEVSFQQCASLPEFPQDLIRRHAVGLRSAAEHKVDDRQPRVPSAIGRLGGLICGEHLMTLVRAAMIGLGEEIHVAVFPGAFALHTGPQLEEWDAGHQAF